MKKLYFALTAFCAFQLNAQITLEKQHFATVGAEERMSSASTTTAIDFSTGANHTWDFSNLGATTQLVEEYNPISDLGAMAAMQFGNFAPDKYKATYYHLNQDLPLQNLPSFLPITFSDYTSVMRLTNDSLSLVGVTISINGQSLPIRYSEIEAQYYFPINYGDSYTTRGRFDQDLNPIYDAQWRQKRQHEVEVDGWGQITTPLGTFDALRIKHTIEEQDSMYVSVNSFGMWLPINVPTQVNYEWRTQSEKSPLVRVKTNIVQGNEVVRSIQFRDNNIVSVDEFLSKETMIYPNPVRSELNVTAEANFSNYEILSLDGKLIQTGAFQNAISCESIQNGMYLLRLKSESGTITKTFIKE